MALRIGCPHCKEQLVVPDELAGEQGFCSLCGGGFTVPRPALVEKAPPPPTPEMGKSCPHCHTQVASGTVLCPKCLTNVDTGQRMALGQRLALVKPLTWIGVGIGSVVAIALSFVAFSTYRSHNVAVDAAAVEAASQPSSVPAPTSVPVYVSKMLNAASEVELKAAIVEVRNRGQAGTDELGEALAKLPTRSSAQQTRNQLAAVEYLLASRDRAVIPYLETVAKRPALERDVLIARGLLGDGRVKDALCGAWLDAARSRMFFERLGQLVGPDDGGVCAAAARRAAQQAERLSDSLRVLNEHEDAGIVERLLEKYWDSWTWLGQTRDERFSAAVWEVAKPRDESDADFKNRVRRARRVLDRSSQVGTPSVRAAAGLVLANSGPQYQTLKKDIMATLVTMFGEASAMEQQRIVWTLSRLAGRAFGGLDDSQQPVDADRAAVDAMLKWATEQGVGTPGTPRTKFENFSRPPAFARRVITPQVQREQSLLDGLDRGWSALGKTLDDWRAAKLGYTPRIAALFARDRGERGAVRYAAAMILAVEASRRDALPAIEALRQARDLPPTLRTMAGVAEALIEQRRSDWPILLSAAELADGSDKPGLDAWARLIAAGGRRAIDTLRESTGSLDASERVRLADAAETHLQSRIRGDGN
ncbi:MAG: hypothetical protein ACKVS9_15715 [Phycisphaerae bacterium]